MLSILMRGVSTRNYCEVLPEMAEQVGASKSQVSRENFDTGERLLQELAERDFRQHDPLILYVDGLRFGDYFVVAAWELMPKARSTCWLCGEHHGNWTKYPERLTWQALPMLGELRSRGETRR